MVPRSSGGLTARTADAAFGSDGGEFGCSGSRRDRGCLTQARLIALTNSARPICVRVAQPLGGEDRLHLLDRLSNVAVDDDVRYSAQWLISSAAFAILRRTTSSGS